MKDINLNTALRCIEQYDPNMCVRVITANRNYTRLLYAKSMRATIKKDIAESRRIGNHLWDYLMYSKVTTIKWVTLDTGETALYLICDTHDNTETLRQQLTSAEFFKNYVPPIL